MIDRLDSDAPPAADGEGRRLPAVEDRLLEDVSNALLGPSTPYTRLAFDLWRDGGQPIIGSIGLRGEWPETEMIFCYRTTSDPGRPRAMVHRVQAEDELSEDPAGLGSYAFNAITQGDLEPRDLDDLGDLTGVRWSRESSARHAIERHEFDPSRRNVFVSFDVKHDQTAAERLVEQSKRPDSPFVVVGSSGTLLTDQNWWEEARRTIDQASNVAVICDLRDPVAQNIEWELHIANSMNKPHFLLAIGEPGSGGRKPQMAYVADRIYTWTWENLLTLLLQNGDAPRPPGFREKRASQS